jgi:hypothetical protein
MRTYPTERLRIFTPDNKVGAGGLQKVGGVFATGLKVSVAVLSGTENPSREFPPTEPTETDTYCRNPSPWFPNCVGEITAATIDVQ